MARSYAPIVLAVWRNDEFTNLDVEAQRLYFLILSQPNIDYCGVLPYMPGRWSKLAKASTPARLRRAANELETARFIVIDTETEELWVRSFVKHNAVLTQPNIAKAMRSAYGHIASLAIRQQFYKSLPIEEQKLLVSPFPPDPPHGNGKPLPQGEPQAEPFGEGQAEPLAPTQGLGSSRASLEGFDLDLEPQPEPKPGPSSSSPADDDDPPPWAWIDAERRLAVRLEVPPEVLDVEAWLRKAATRTWMRHAVDVAAWQADDPELTNHAIARRLAPPEAETEADRIRRIAQGVASA